MIYVLQHHRARALHYDFRLELDGVVLSWAVPKGPSLAPRVRRLAMRVDDHELAHATYEGPTVIIWDRGTWEPEGDAHAGLATGKLAFALHGEKLHGRWHLRRTQPLDKRESWLLFKGKDEHASDTIDITRAQPASVITGRPLP